MPSAVDCSIVNSLGDPASLLRETCDWNLQQLRELQLRKLAHLVKHACEYSPFYAERFAKAGLPGGQGLHGLHDLNRLPVLTKSDIRAHAALMTCSGPCVRDVAQNSTGGSTGVPLNFFQDKNYRRWADAARERAWRGIDGVDPGALEAVLWGAVRDVGRKTSWRGFLGDLLRRRTIALNTFDLNRDKILNFFRIYNLLRPQILRGYASSLYFISQLLRHEGLEVASPRIVISSAEMLWPQMRRAISDTFRADVLDSYGCREVSQIATECRMHAGLHVVMENQIVEIVNGNIIVTNLNNWAMPFIRYQVGDLAEGITQDVCACGRAAERIVGLKGRDNDSIQLPSGTVINGEFFEFLFFGLESVERFQVTYSRRDEELLVRLQVKDRSESVDRHVIERMRQCFGFDAVRVQFTDEFDVAASGKFRFVTVVDSF